MGEFLGKLGQWLCGVRVSFACRCCCVGLDGSEMDHQERLGQFGLSSDCVILGVETRLTLDLCAVFG